MAGLGTEAKMAFRIESDQGMVSGAYPTTEAEADAEEVVLDGYDQVPFASESITEGRESEIGETLLSSPAISHHDLVSIAPGGSVEIHGFYDGLDQLLAAVMGYSHPGTDAAPISPDYTKGTGEIAGTATGTQAVTKLVDTGSPFATGDVGKFIQLYGANAAAGQIRRITAFVSANEVTVGTNWSVAPIDASTTYRVSQEIQHFYELAQQMQDELWTDEFSSYPTTGVGTTNDKIFRRGTLGIWKGGSKPWIWRSCFINSMTFNFSAKAGMTITVDVVPFNLDRNSATNSSTAAGWAFSESGLFTPSENERILFNHLSGSGFLRIDTFANGAMTSADEYGISDFSITINNNLKIDDQDALTSEFRVQPARGGHREVTGSFTLPRYSNDTFQDWAKAETILQAHINFSGSTIATIPRAFEIFISSFKLEAPQAPVTGAEVIKQTYNFRALIQASAPTFIASGNPTQYITTPRSELMIRTTNQFPFNALLDKNKEY